MVSSRVVEQETTVFRHVLTGTGGVVTTGLVDELDTQAGSVEYDVTQFTTSWRFPSLGMINSVVQATELARHEFAGSVEVEVVVDELDDKQAGSVEYDVTQFTTSWRFPSLGMITSVVQATEVARQVSTGSVEVVVVVGGPDDKQAGSVEYDVTQFTMSCRLPSLGIITSVVQATELARHEFVGSVEVEVVVDELDDKQAGSVEYDVTQFTTSWRLPSLGIITSVVQATELARQVSTGSAEVVVVVVDDVVEEVVCRTRHSRSV